MKFVITIALAFLASVSSAQALDPLKDARICGAPKRTADGSILRRADVLSAFQKAHPCPSTSNSAGACPGWGKDHVIPLTCGGCDAVSNLQWLPLAMKSAAGSLPKDRWERKINCTPMQVVTP